MTDQGYTCFRWGGSLGLTLYQRRDGGNPKSDRCMGSLRQVPDTLFVVEALNDYFARLEAAGEPLPDRIAQWAAWADDQIGADEEIRFGNAELDAYRVE